MIARLLLVAAASTLLAAQQEPLPRFRAGANLVSVDAYFTKDGTPVTDLTADEVEIFEDERPQKVEGFRLVKPGGQGTTITRTDPIGRDAEREALADPEARVFVLYFDQWHVSFEGSSKAAAPVTEILNRVIGANDLVAVMTPELPARSISFTRRTSAIERMLRDAKTWGERGSAYNDPLESAFVACYPDTPSRPGLRGVAKELIERRREQKTLESLDDLVTHLGTLRDERKFVVVFTEGWVQFGRNDRLGGILEPTAGVPSGPPLGVGTDGRLTASPRPEAGGQDACERERVKLSYIDHTVEIRELAQRANRANVTFYGVDPRGLAPFDDPIGPLRPAGPVADRERMASRQGGLRELAENTDGAVVLNTNDVRGGVARMLGDLGAYYLMNYYSTNPKLDGRFRRIRVTVKRPGVEVRARAGYLAPTEAEARAAGGTTSPAAKSGPPESVRTALDAIAPSRGNLPVRIQAAGARGTIRAIVELDAATLKQPEWSAGGSMRVTVTPEKGSGAEQAVTLTIDPGQRSVAVDNLSTRLTPGRYSVRAELTPKNGRIPVQATTFVVVPVEDAMVGGAALAQRRGPSTGLAYVPTADARYRRTERLKVEVPLLNAAATATGRVLTREGQPLPLVVTYSTRTDQAASITFGVADVTLAPLAASEYVLELTFTANGKKETVAYGFRIIP